ncbi:DUF5689 domain-containing protein [Empedobacter brevis]|uniref:DUF5689 domain-containing protein n=1 Tax=Empedobacter brevis TaxID=247 RepID=UPI002FE017FC
MNTISKLTIASLLSLGLFITQSCVQDDDYNVPPVECPKVDANISIKDLKERLTTGQLNIDDKGNILDDLIVEGYVISDDETGNIYKTLMLQNSATDGTDGIQFVSDLINLYTKYPLGSKIQIHLKGLKVASDRGAIKIGSSVGQFSLNNLLENDIKSKIFRTCDPVTEIKPRVFTNIKDVLKEENINTVVTLEGIQFLQPEIDKTYAEKEITKDRKLQDKNGDEVILRNSGYAKWWQTSLPTGSGSIRVIVSRYNSTWQLYINDTNDVKFDQARFEILPQGVEEIKGSKEDFESAKKNSYGVSDLALSTGTWIFSDGGVFDPSDNDLKNSGTSSVRLRGGSTLEGFIQSKFFVTGLKTLKVYFGGSTFNEGEDTDKEIKLEVLISTDFGVTWKSIGEKTSERGKLNLLEFPINAADTDRVSVKLVNKSFLRTFNNNRLRVNIDDVEFVK